jgi:Transglutaminase-like superfamily
MSTNPLWKVNIAAAGLVVICSFVVPLSRESGEDTSVPPQRLSYTQLALMPGKELVMQDIARMNLVCAEGLPGAEGLDVGSQLGVLNHWAEVVKETERKYLAQYYLHPKRYDNSVAKFKAVNLALTLKQDLGCAYNKSLMASGVMADIHSTHFFHDSRDLFLHGLTQKRKGTCASLPVLMVAVGRRCGYPLYLVACKGHLYCRWDDGKERFNLETACEGADSQPDEYYYKWPNPIEDEELRSEKFLKSLTSQEQLGVFCQIRGACLKENGRTREATEAYEVALRFFPESKVIKTLISQLKGEN